MLPSLEFSTSFQKRCVYLVSRTSKVKSIKVCSSRQVMLCVHKLGKVSFEDVWFRQKFRRWSGDGVCAVRRRVALVYIQQLQRKPRRGVRRRSTHIAAVKLAAHSHSYMCISVKQTSTDRIAFETRHKIKFCRVCTYVSK